MPYVYSPPPLTPPVPGVTPPPSPLTLYGLGMTPAEFAQSRAPHRPNGWLFVSMAVLGGIFGTAAFGITAVYVGAVQSRLIFFLMLAALALAVIGIARQKAQSRREETAAWRVYLAESEGGVVTTFYPDRVEQHTARWQTTLFFTDKTRFSETRDLMILEDGAQRVVLRAADLMPEQAQAAFEILCMCVPPDRQYAAGRFAARRAQPAPPPFSTTPPVCYDRFVYREQATPAFRGLPAGLLPWLLAADLVCAGMFTALFAVTASFLLDFLLFFFGLFAVTVGAALFLLWRWDKTAARQTEEEITLSFTAAGLRIERQGQQRFVAAADVHARRTENGAHLFTPAGEFTFPWTATQNRQQLEWMLFSQRPVSF